LEAGESVTHFHSDLTAWDGAYADQQPTGFVPNVACFSLVSVPPDLGPPVFDVHGSDSDTETDTDFDASSDDSEMYAYQEDGDWPDPALISGDKVDERLPSPVAPEYWPTSPCSV
jgi:hypothetical protein